MVRTVPSCLPLHRRQAEGGNVGDPWWAQSVCIFRFCLGNLRNEGLRKIDWPHKEQLRLAKRRNDGCRPVSDVASQREESRWKGGHLSEGFWEKQGQLQFALVSGPDKCGDPRGCLALAGATLAPRGPPSSIPERLLPSSPGPLLVRANG